MRNLLLLILFALLFELISLGCALQIGIIILYSTGALVLTRTRIVILVFLGNWISLGLLYLFVKLGGSRK